VCITVNKYGAQERQDKNLSAFKHKATARVSQKENLALTWQPSIQYEVKKA
jgi:hypothetical protein